MTGNAHGCEFDWCCSDRAMSETEHFGDGTLELSHAEEIGRIHCYAFVTDDGHVYEDEITLGIDTARDFSYNASLTVEEATRLRDLLDTAIKNREEVRNRPLSTGKAIR